MNPTKQSCWITPRGKVGSLESLEYLRLTAVRTDQEVVAKLAELDMMVADLEHANSRVATVERRNVG